MQIAQDTVVSLEVRLADVHGNLIQESAEAVQYLHGGYDGIFPLVEQALQGREPGANVEVHLEDFVDILVRNFRQPEEGLGFDNSPVAHMWRTLMWPTRFL